MNRFKNHSKLIIFLVLSLCLFMRCIQGQQIQYNPKCTADAPYWKTFDTPGCIQDTDCRSSLGNSYVYLSQNSFFCSDTDQYCKPTYINETGYYKYDSDGDVPYTACYRCTPSTPIYQNSQCEQCPDKKIFSYVPLTGQTEPCITIDEIKLSKNTSGIFDVDLKIYYLSDYTCNRGQISKSLIFQTGDGQLTFKKCEWCPLDTPVTKDDGSNTCSPCSVGQITDEANHSCLINKYQCRNILSKDEKICYQSTCPLGQFIDSSIPQSKKCNTCSGNKFPSVDQKSCVDSCGANEALHEATSSCIPSEACDGFYSDIDTGKTKCLKDSCQRELASFELAASIVQKKADDKSYQVCSTCPEGKKFVKVDGQDPINECKNCATDYSGTISDYVTGVCISLENIKKYGILNEDETIFYPADKYICKSGYYPSKKSNSHIEYGFCEKCPGHLPIFDGITCTNNCPDGQVAYETTGTCVSSGSFKCDLRVSTDTKLCSTVCKPGEKMVGNYQCQKCSDGEEFSSQDFRMCISSSSCYYDFEIQTCFDSFLYCPQKGKEYFYQKDSQICKKGCGNNEIKSLINTIPTCIDKCISYSYFVDDYQYCQDSCKNDEFAIEATKICKKKAECTKFMTGTPSQCLDACQEGEVILDEQFEGQTYKQCVVANQCKTALVQQNDNSFICTKNCNKFVNSEDKKCIDACPTEFYQDSQKTNSNYYICYKTCPLGKLYFTSTDGKKQCIEKSECTLNISSDSTMCTADCLVNERAYQNGGVITCKLDGFDCGSKKYQYKYKNYKICSDICNHILDGDYCEEKCPPNAKYALEKKQSETFQKCTSTCDKYFFLNNLGNFECSSTCSTYLDIDNKQCLKACNSSHYILEQEQSETFQKCSVDCSKIKYTDNKGIQKCVSICSDYLQVETQTCVASCQPSEFTYDKVENETYTKCSSACDDIEYTDEKGVKKCVKQCSDYLSPNKKVCKKSCGSDEFINEKVEGESHIQCSTTCSNFKSAQGGLKYCKKQCLLFVSSSDKKLCQTSCLSDFVMDKKPDADYAECSSTCDDIEYTDDKQVKRCMKECQFYLSANKKSCNTSCSSDEFINDKVEGQSHIQCSTSCPESTYQQVDDKGKKYCVKECKDYLSSDKKVCANSCPFGEFVNEKNGKSYYQCTLKCDSYSYTDEKGIKRCTDICPFYLGTNGKDCNQSCQGSEYTKDKENGEIFFRCSAACDGFEYDTGDKIKRCGKACPNNQIIFKNDTQNKCFKTKKECTSVISTKGNECIQKCITDNSEYPKNMNGFRLCTPCQGYYKADDQTCLQACGTDEIGFPTIHQCFNKSEGVQKCKDMKFKLSADKSKCTETCQYPEITSSSGECNSPCDPQNSDCSNCLPGEFIFQNGSIQSCSDNCGEMYISSDNKRCIYDCSYIRELAPENGKSCLKCKDEEVLVLQSSNKYICKSIEDPKIFTDRLNTAKVQVEQQMKSKDQIEEVKNQVAEIAKETFKQLSESKDKTPKELLNEVVNLTKTMVKNINIVDFATVPYKIGSKENILVQVQKKATGFRYKKNLDLDQILNNSNYSLTEENLDEEQETITSLATSIIASNPACKTEVCKTYPVFSLEKTENTGRRILQQSQDFTVTFILNDSTDIKKYICLSYDLSNPTADPTKLQTTIGNDNKSISCLVSGGVSILLDSTCQYVDKSLCPKKDENNSNNDDDEDELNGGQIAGIVIGVIAFVGVSVLIVLQIIKNNKIKKSKEYQQPKDNKHQQFHTETEERVNTLGINAPEKQL